MTDHAARVASIGGGHNVRDLGGLPTIGGGNTASSRLYRSEFLALLQDDVAAANDGLDLKSVVDLRRFSETRHERIDWAVYDVDYFHCPFKLSTGDSWSTGYHQYLEAGPDRVVRAIRILANPANHPALFHCAAGKDRTGVVAALLLDLAGADRAEIAADYLFSARGLEPVLTRLARQAPYREALEAATLQGHLPRSESITGFFSWLDRTWGGAESWLLRHGLPADEIEVFRSSMVRP